MTRLETRRSSPPVREVVEREREPGPRVRAPDSLLVGAWIELEEVRHACRFELGVQALVLRAKARVALPHVEREERRAALKRAAKLRHERVRARVPVLGGGADVEGRRPGRIRRMLVAAPRLDDREVREVMEGEQDRAVPAGG